jgi:hypothetical protein
MSETPNMIKVFPGSDDSRGTTTRINISEPGLVNETRSPEMRPDEYEGVIANEMKYNNFTRQAISICSIIPVNGVKTLNSQFTEGQYFDQFLEGVGEVEEKINDRLSTICTSLGVDTVTFTVTRVDVLNSNWNTSGLHNQNNTHTVFVTLNYDCIFYGQFSPNPFIEPAPEPEPCLCFTPSFTTTKNFGNSNNFGTLLSNTFNINGTQTTQNGSLYVRAQAAAPDVYAQATAANILTPNVFYTLKYDISANLQPIVTPGSFMQITVKVNSTIVGIFDLNTIAKSGYMQFLATPGWNNPTIVEVTYTKAFALADRSQYQSATAIWHVNFQLCNASCQNIMP